MSFSISDGIAILELLYRIFSRFYRFIRDLNYRLRRISFYIDDYTKTVTVCQDGHGIIINAFRIKVLDWQKFNIQGLERYFDINETSKKSTRLPPLQEMMSTPISGRFTDFGFWYQSTANIIQFDHTMIDQQDYKSWSFKVDPTCIDIIKGNMISLSYAISVPGLFPVRDGYFDLQQAQCETPFRSELCIKNQINRITYVVSLDKAIKVKSRNVAAKIVTPRVNDQNDIRVPRIKYEDDLFYYRFFFTKRFPKFQSNFIMEWDVARNDESLLHTGGISTAGDARQQDEMNKIR